MQKRDTHSWDDLSLPFFPPLGYLRVDLVPKLRFDLASITGEEREETLRPTVDDIDLVQRDGVDDLLTFLNFTLWALNELRLHRKKKVNFVSE